ncbi:MAG: sugar phosphate isomerase/epimerase [Isosphaeraceae bacterium]|nr:sugar phosphate isomerase/epimerase [Isosphaeraceae bacterium]
MIRLGICNELFEGWDFARVCRTVKDLGYEGLEIAPFTLAPKITDVPRDRLREYRRIIEEAGLRTIGLHWLLAKTEGFYLTSPDPEVRRRTADYLKALAEATSELGGTLMVFGSPKQRNLLPGVTFEAALGYAEEVFRALLPTLGSLGIDLCLEPLAPSETDFLTSIDQANTLIARLDHPNVKLHMDVKAQSSDPGGTVPDLILRHARQAGHFHAQDTNLKGPGMGAVDFGPILRALVASGYDGWVSVEVFDYSAGAEETAAQSIRCLRRELEAALAESGTAL